MLRECPRSCLSSHRALLLPGQLCWASQFVSQLNLFSVCQTMVEVNYFRSFLVTITFKTIRSRLILQHFSLRFCQPFVVNLSTSGPCRPASQMPSFGLGYLGTSPFLFLSPPKQSSLQLGILLLFAQNIPELALQECASPCSQGSIPDPETSLSVKCQNGYIDCCLGNA